MDKEMPAAAGVCLRCDINGVNPCTGPPVATTLVNLLAPLFRAFAARFLIMPDDNTFFINTHYHLLP